MAICDTGNMFVQVPLPLPGLNPPTLSISQLSTLQDSVEEESTAYLKKHALILLGGEMSHSILSTPSHPGNFTHLALTTCILDDICTSLRTSSTETGLAFYLS